MANYVANTRTNYFRVTDEKALEAIMANACSEDGVELWTETIKGEKYFAFGCYDAIDYRCDIGEDEDDDNWDYNVDRMYEELQKIVHPEDAIIITEVGHEKLRYLSAVAIIITATDIEVFSLDKHALEMAQIMLDNTNYQTQFDY